jgi:hypothetical protein
MSAALLFPDPPRSECVFSACRRYRYQLTRKVGTGAKGTCLWVMANPSIADEHRLDPTLTRCADYTARWGYGVMTVVNVRAWVSTDPKAMPADPTAFGPDNWSAIATAATSAQLVVCGWGKLGGDIGEEVLRLLFRCHTAPHALKLNGDGSPCHPLYLAKALEPFRMVSP